MNSPVVTAVDEISGLKMRCVRCGAGNLSKPSIGDYYLCSHCRTQFPVIEGVPFLIGYSRDEGESLFELTAKMGEFQESADRKARLFFAEKLVKAFETGKPEEAKEGLNEANRDFFDKRYKQYANLRRFLDPLRPKGLNILDIGAGSGFDSLLLQMLGAKVTAIEFNPYSIVPGRAVADATTWFCASASCLPFRDESFDCVVATAALHHMVKVSDVISESLRVLRVGGALISINDPYKAGHYRPDHDLKVFNDHNVVRRGVNELVSYFDSFAAPLVAHKDELKVEFHTDRLQIFDKTGKVTKNIDEPRTWGVDSVDHLKRTSGRLFMCVRKLKPGKWDAPVLDNGYLPPERVFGGVSRPMALKNIANFLPRKQMVKWLERKSGNSKLELLNGWQLKEPSDAGRRARGLANLYIERSDVKNRPPFVIETQADAGKAELTVTLDGRPMVNRSLAGGDRVEFEIAPEQLDAKQLSVLSVGLSAPGGQPAFTMRYA
ncbi:MAG TPA: class I SAM-dependent methyltransferase [Rhizomicrobium sp.]